MAMSYMTQNYNKKCNHKNCDYIFCHVFTKRMNRECPNTYKA